MIRRPSAQRLGEARRRRALYSGLDGSGGPRRRLVTDAYCRSNLGRGLVGAAFGSGTFWSLVRAQLVQFVVAQRRGRAGARQPRQPRRQWRAGASRGQSSAARRIFLMGSVSGRVRRRPAGRNSAVKLPRRPRRWECHGGGHWRALLVYVGRDFFKKKLVYCILR